MKSKHIGRMVKDFYERHPFPNYDDFDNLGSLIDGARKGIFAKLLDEQIPFGVRIFEIGCGTGQLSSFLSIANRTVVGADISFNSLKSGEEFRERNMLERVQFLQMDLFHPAFKPESFDLVICHGVLHHTQDPFLGFQTIAPLVRRKGYIIIGLYHKYGRIITDIRRLIFKIFPERCAFLDPRLKNLPPAKRDVWFADQYQNPHESKHTICEVLGWFKQAGFQFVNSIPKARLFESFSEQERLFKPSASGNWFELFLVEVGMLFSANKNNGLFVVIGQKKNG